MGKTMDEILDFLYYIYNLPRNMILAVILRLLTQKTESGYRGEIRSGILSGHKITFPYLERLAYLRGTYEPHIAECLSQQVKKTAIIYDVGANCGYLSMIMAELSSDGKVFSFEPDQRNIKAIKQNISDNNIKNIRIISHPVNDRGGAVRFATYSSTLISHIAIGDQAPDAEFIDMNAITLDQFVYDDGNPPPDLIKIDVEGGEVNVLLGSNRLLHEFTPDVIVEIRDFDNEYKTVCEYMKNFGYKQKKLGGGIETLGVEDVLFWVS